MELRSITPPSTTFSPIFLKPLILRARRARKIKGFRKIGEGIKSSRREGWLRQPSLLEIAPMGAQQRLQFPPANRG